MSLPRVAWLAPYLPAPLVSGGALRMHHLARALGGLAELHLYARAPWPEALRKRGDAALTPFARVTTGYDYTARDRAPDLPRRVAGASPRRLVDALRRAHAARPYAALVVAHAHAAAPALSLGVPWLLDEHNVESAYLEDTLRARGDLADAARRPVAEREVAGLRAFERHAWARATAVTCVSAADAAAIAAVRGQPPQVVPNGTDLSGAVFRAPSQRTSRDLLFVGAMAHPPNAAAARLLAREVLPRVRAAVPGARLVLCGAAPGAEVRALAGPDVVVTGTVPTVAPYLRDAAVYVSALGHGAGSSLKTIEALACGVPLVSTAVGARGHGLVDGEHYVRADTPEALAAAAIDVLEAMRRRDAARLGALDARARAGRVLAARHDWRAVAAPFVAALADVLGAAP
jgi:glycosyltransferase involved in cell wall biosynthesis